MHLANSHVCHLDDQLLVLAPPPKQISRLDVSVVDAERVEVVEPVAYLFANVDLVGGGKLEVFEKVVIRQASVAQLHRHEYVLAATRDCVQS